MLLRVGIWSVVWCRWLSWSGNGTDLPWRGEHLLCDMCVVEDSSSTWRFAAWIRHLKSQDGRQAVPRNPPIAVFLQFSCRRVPM
ncbi:hypothetical protein HDV57DRAFT_500656 [Trichoderma longibrachiatum]